MSPVKQVIVDGSPITPQDVVEVARRQAKAVPGDNLASSMGPARQVVADAVASDEVVYGITTGLGALVSTHIGRDQVEALQYNLIRSHASGVGDPLEDEIVRAILLLRARTLAQGHSGVRPVIVEKLLEMLERDILPVIPSQGSVGASGDLAPFAHMALAVIGEGKVRIDGETLPTSESGLEPVQLEAKEGLSLLNGTEGMAAMGALALDKARKLVVAADVACALTVEAMTGSSRPFRVHCAQTSPGLVRQRREVEKCWNQNRRIDHDHRLSRNSLIISSGDGPGSTGPRSLARSKTSSSERLLVQHMSIVPITCTSQLFIPSGRISFAGFTKYPPRVV